MDLLRPDLTLWQYTELLRRTYQLYACLEEQVACALPAARHGEVELNARRKAGLLRNDLAVLGVRPVPEPIHLCSVDDEAAAWGTLYVLEGATLGGQVICRHLGPRLGLDAQSGLSFYASYGELVGPRWKAFCTLLTEAGQNAVDPPGFERGAVRAAQQIFSAFGTWVVPALSSEVTPAGSRRPEGIPA